MSALTSRNEKVDPSESPTWDPRQLAGLLAKRLAAFERGEALPSNEQKACFWLSVLANHVRSGVFTPERGEFAAERIARGEDFDMTPDEKARLDATQAGRTGSTIDTGDGPKPATGAEVMHSLERVLRTQARRATGSALASTVTRSAPRPRESRAPASRRQRSSATKRGSPASRSDSEDEPSEVEGLCGFCGEPLEAGSNPRRRYHERCGNAKRQRDFKARQRGSERQEELSERAGLAWAAVKSGADPLGVIELITRPTNDPGTEADARAGLLRAEESSIVEELRLLRVELLMQESWSLDAESSIDDLDRAGLEDPGVK